MKKLMLLGAAGIAIYLVIFSVQLHTQDLAAWHQVPDPA